MIGTLSALASRPIASMISDSLLSKECRYDVSLSLTIILFSFILSRYIPKSSATAVLLRQRLHIHAMQKAVAEPKKLSILPQPPTYSVDVSAVPDPAITASI